LVSLAGFSSKVALVNCQEFIDMLLDRPSMKELWEKKLFKRIIEYVKHLSSEQFFDLMDINSDGTFTPSELRKGIESIKI